MHGKDVEATNKKIEAYKTANKQSIARNNARLSVESRSIAANKDGGNSLLTRSVHLSIAKLLDKDDEQEQQRGDSIQSVKKKPFVRRDKTMFDAVATKVRQPRREVWHTGPLDTVPLSPYLPTPEMVAEMLERLHTDRSFAKECNLVITHEMTAGGVKLELLVERMLTIAAQDKASSSSQIKAADYLASPE